MFKKKINDACVDNYNGFIITFLTRAHVNAAVIDVVFTPDINMCTDYHNINNNNNIIIILRKTKEMYMNVRENKYSQ